MNLVHQTLRVGTGFPALARRATGAGRARARAHLAVQAAIRPVETPEAALAREGVTFKQPLNIDRSQTKTGIMHVGVGGFHRSHQLVRLPTRIPRIRRARDLTRPGAFGSSQTTRTVPCQQSI